MVVSRRDSSAPWDQKGYGFTSGIRNRNMSAHKVGRLLKFQVKEVDQWVREGKAACENYCD